MPVILTGDTLKIFVSTDESNSARILIGCKPIYNLSFRQISNVNEHNSLGSPGNYYPECRESQ